MIISCKHRRTNRPVLGLLATGFSRQKAPDPNTAQDNSDDQVAGFAGWASAKPAAQSMATGADVLVAARSLDSRAVGVARCGLSVPVDGTADWHKGDRAWAKAGDSAW
jgi:hypothetical protein